MPRESVIGQGGGYNLKVGWQAARGVQVGVTDGRFTIDGEVFDSVWTSLDRQGCNDLIRLLRKARDSAFGSDQ